MKPNLTDNEASVLFYLLEKSELSYESFINWAYSQYENDGALAWVEKAALTVDLREAKDLLRNEFNITDLSGELLAGEIAYKYSSGLITDQEAVNALYDIICFGDEWPKEIQDKVYIMDDYYGWHDNPSSVVTPMLNQLLSEFEATYKAKAELFCVSPT